jgi:YlmC/YmxH family sporulation protein
MARISFSQLRDKDVINLCDATRIGYIGEIEFDSNTGQICSLILCRGGGVLGFGREERVYLPWGKIECIGEDAILVKMPPEDLSESTFQRYNKRKRRDCDCK